MGLTKEYLRYGPAGNFNVIVSGNCNIQFVTLEAQEGRFVAVGACEHIIIWDLRVGEKAQVLSGEKSHVSCICASPNGQQLAAGYGDGTVQVYDLKSGDVVSIFSGHKSEVTSLSYDAFGHKLASGSKDTDIIVWDTVAETGVCRFSGHKGPITQTVFMSKYDILISSSKDGLVKFWDLDTQYCFKTIVGHRSEIWSLRLVKNDKYLVTGCGDAELRVWQLLCENDVNSTTENKNLVTQLELTDITGEEDQRYPLRCIKAGSILRAGRGRVVSMTTDPTGSILVCHGSDNQLELFQLCSEQDTQTRHKKRLKKEQKKARKSEEKTEIEVEQIDGITLRDEVRRLPIIKVHDKPKSIDALCGRGGEIRVVTSLANNILELYSIQDDPHLLRSINSQGHRSQIRAIAFSSDNLALISGGGDGIKLWNRSSQICLRTIPAQQVISICFVPGDRHALAGLQDGRLLILDLSAGDILEEIPAHTQGTELWSICLQPDMRGCVTGGGDRSCKWWQFELIEDEGSESKAKVLSLLHTRTLALEEGVLCVKLSPNDRFVAVALLDSTVKIFYTDSFKLHVSLYGHKLPVLCMDISFDARLIATGSADRNIKIWGLDFGDCHKSIFAHDDSITGLQFIARTHLFFTCGRDGTIRQWDADLFQRITTLPSHKGEAWNLAVSPDGRYLVSCGSDQVLRMCARTNEPLVLEDERETERELEESQHLAHEQETNSALPSRRTVGSEQATDSLLECLSICASFREQLTEHAALQAASERQLPALVPPPLMLAYNVTTTEDFLLHTLKRIRSSDMEEALLLLPFNSACELLQALPPLIARADHTELICRVLIFLLKIHHAPLVANQLLLPLLAKIQKLTVSKVTELRDMVGYNLHGMKYIQREIEAVEGVQLFRDASRDKRAKTKKSKQRERAKKSIMLLST